MILKVTFETTDKSMNGSSQHIQQFFAGNTKKKKN